MSNPVLTSLIDDQTSPAQPKPPASVSLDAIRTLVSALETSDIITPELFGAIPNDPAAHITNFDAIEAWLNAGHLGLQVADPNNVYYVSANPTGGDGAARPFSIYRRCWVPLLRLAVVKRGAGFSYYFGNIAAGLPFGTAADQIAIGNRSFNINNQNRNTATRGQTTWIVDDDGTTAPPQPGDRLGMSVGHDQYDFDGATGFIRQAYCVSYSRNTLTNLGTLVADLPCPDNFPERTDSRADVPRIGVLSPLNDVEGSWIGFMEIDMTLFGEEVGMSYPFSASGCRGVTIDTFVFRGYPRRDTQSFYMGPGSENITIGQLFVAQNSNAIDGVSQGGCSMFHNIGSRCEYFHANVAAGDYMSFREGYTEIFTFGEMHVNFTGRFNTGQQQKQWYQSQKRITFSISESRPLIIGTLRYTSRFDLHPNYETTASGDDDGLWLAGANTGAKLPIIERLESNKDWMFLGCDPLYVSTKSVEGPLSFDTRHYRFGAAGAGQQRVEDYDIGRVFLQSVTMNYGAVNDPSRFEFQIYTEPYNPDRGIIDQGFYVTNYYYYGGYAEGNKTPAGVWFGWLTPGILTNVGKCTINTTKNGKSNRHFRYVGFNGEPAGNSMKIQYGYYPMKGVFTESFG